MTKKHLLLSMLVLLKASAEPTFFNWGSNDETSLSVVPSSQDLSSQPANPDPTLNAETSTIVNGYTPINGQKCFFTLEEISNEDNSSSFFALLKDNPIFANKTPHKDWRDIVVKFTYDISTHYYNFLKKSVKKAIWNDFIKNLSDYNNHHNLNFVPKYTEFDDYANDNNWTGIKPRIDLKAYLHNRYGTADKSQLASLSFSPNVEYTTKEETNLAQDLSQFAEITSDEPLTLENCISFLYGYNVMVWEKNKHGQVFLTHAFIWNKPDHQDLNKKIRHLYYNPHHEDGPHYHLLKPTLQSANDIHLLSRVFYRKRSVFQIGEDETQNYGMKKFTSTKRFIENRIKLKQKQQKPLAIGSSEAIARNTVANLNSTDNSTYPDFKNDFKNMVHTAKQTMYIHTINLGKWENKQQILHEISLAYDMILPLLKGAETVFAFRKAADFLLRYNKYGEPKSFLEYNQNYQSVPIVMEISAPPAHPEDDVERDFNGQLSHFDSLYNEGQKQENKYNQIIKARLAKLGYKIFDLPSNASATDIRKAYFKLVLKVHPDKPTGSEEAFKVVQNVYDSLTEWLQIRSTT
jgi:uncharacterized protein YceH (UPF0502 family)